MRTMQHVCGRMVNVDFFDSHGEIILDLTDPEDGAQIRACLECGEVIEQGCLFPLDFFPEVFAEMAESLIEEV